MVAPCIDSQLGLLLPPSCSQCQGAPQHAFSHLQGLPWLPPSGMSAMLQWDTAGHPWAVRGAPDAPHSSFCSRRPPCLSPPWFLPASAPPHTLFLLPGWHIFLGRMWAACTSVPAPPFLTPLSTRAIPLKRRQEQVLLLFPTFDASHCGEREKPCPAALRPPSFRSLKGPWSPLPQSPAPLLPVAPLSFCPSAQPTGSLLSSA